MVGKGGKFMSWIPAHLAYGAGGDKELGVEPNSTLCYEVEVIDVISYRRKR